jgi:ribonuclease HII
VIIDAFYIKHVRRKNQLAIIGGDQKSATIAAASIIAKVYRDNLMKKLAKKYNQYGFGKHKGYGTKMHQEAIKKHGFSKIHRTSYNLSYLFQ